MSYNFNSIVSKSEANALKEMIFQRVRERSESMTDDIQNDVMDIARESFVSKNNPFSQIINKTVSDIEINTKPELKSDTVEISSKSENKENLEIGFPQRELKARAQEQERMVKDEISTIALRNTMNEARESLTNKKSFLGALNFLNSQGAVSLMRTRSDRFEVIG